MDCKVCQELISRYIDNELDLEEKKEFELHIKNCIICKKELYKMQHIQRVASTSKQPTLPPTFHQELMDKIRKNSNTVPTHTIDLKRSLYSRWGWAAIILVGVIGFYTVERTTDVPKVAMDGTFQKGVRERAVQPTALIYDEAWQVKVNDTSLFMHQLKQYLEENDIKYDINERGVFCYHISHTASFMNWLKEYSEAFEGKDVMEGVNIQIEIQ